MSSPVEQIKSRLNIVDVVGGYLRLNKAGSIYKALCPFHSEKSPSFTVSPTRQSFHCFGCNKGGDVFTFIEEIEGLEFPGALKVLAEKAGVELKPEDRKVTGERERLYSVMETGARFFVSRLRPEHPAYAYLTARGMTPETITNFRIGFAPTEPEGWHALSDALHERGIKDNEIERVGLSRVSEKEAGKYYDRFRSRIMFPIFDSSGRVIAFSGRIFGDAKDDTAKYINSPETPLYDKSTVLFGFDRAKVAMRKQNFAIFVEGQVDLVMSHQAGTENTVAVSGTALTDKHLALVKRLTPNVIFAFDGDGAGVSATMRAFSLALALEMSVRVAQLPKGVDPADLIRENPKKWEEIIGASKHMVDFLLDVVMSDGKDVLETRKAVEEKVLPFVAQIRSSIEQAHFVLEIARKIGVPDTAVWEALGRVRLARTYSSPEAKPVSAPSSAQPLLARLREELIGLLLWQESEEAPRIDVKALRARLQEVTGSDPTEGYSEADKSKAIFRVEQTYEPGKLKQGLIDDLIRRFQISLYEAQQADLHQSLVKAESAKDPDNAKKHLEALQDISRKIQLLKGEENQEDIS